MKRELLYVLTLTKSGRAQLNVLRGEDAQGCYFDAVTEMVFFECQEIMWESIPGSVMQSYALIKSYEDRELLQIVSLFASAAAVGAISSRMSYLYDISPKSRAKAGNFYGYVPDSRRGRKVIQVAMMLISVCQLLTRSLAYALIANSVGKRYAVLIVALEMGLLFVYKLAMKDFYYTGTNTRGFMRFAFSCLMRLNVKIITDFTSLLPLRNPCELG
jgi:hypothetical protein